MIEGTGAHTLLAAESWHAQTALFLFRDRLRPVPAPVFPHVTTMRGGQCPRQSGSPAAYPNVAGARTLVEGGSQFGWLAKLYPSKRNCKDWRSLMTVFLIMEKSQFVVPG